MAKLTRKVLEQFPEVVFVAKKKDGDTQWLDAQEEAADCIEDDGPTVVAHYTLSGVYKLVKTSRTLESVSVKRAK